LLAAVPGYFQYPGWLEIGELPRNIAKILKFVIPYCFQFILMTNSFILIAEDDADDRLLLNTAFREIGYEGKVEFVADGDELMSFLLSSIENEFVPGLILLDLNMPKKGGKEVLKEIKENKGLKKIPVIIFSTTKNESEVEKCYELGANNYVVKPVNYHSLLQFVENIRHLLFMSPKQ
jgi:CheY-like chemotaxis protein